MESTLTTTKGCFSIIISLLLLLLLFSDSILLVLEEYICTLVLLNPSFSSFTIVFFLQIDLLLHSINYISPIEFLLSFGFRIYLSKLGIDHFLFSMVSTSTRVHILVSRQHLVAMIRCHSHYLLFVISHLLYSPI